MPLGMLRTLIGDLLDFCYPGRCAACGADGGGGSPVCAECALRLESLEAAPACTHCAKPIPEWEAPCPWCAGKGLRHYDQVIRLGAFQSPVRDLIHRMKYQRRWGLSEQLADRLWKQGRVRSLLRQADCLVPVPLHALRQVSRGYNQAEVIARQLARLSKLPVVRPAVRVRRTQTQTHLHSRQQRLENLRRAFALVRAGAIRGRRVVVIDDVVTTGATLESLARVLRIARPASLSAIVVAVADPRGADFQRI